MALLWLRHWSIASATEQTVWSSHHVRQRPIEQPVDLCTADDNSAEYSGSVGKWNKAVSQR